MRTFLSTLNLTAVAFAAVVLINGGALGGPVVVLASTAPFALTLLSLHLVPNRRFRAAAWAANLLIAIGFTAFLLIVFAALFSGNAYAADWTFLLLMAALFLPIPIANVVFLERTSANALPPAV